MSLILDALKRAERERRAGQAPQPLDPVAMPSMEAPSTGGRSRLLIAGLLVSAVLAAVLAAWAILHRRAVSPAAATVPASISPASPVVTTASGPANPASPATTTTDATAPAAAKANAATVADDGAATLDDLVDGHPRPADDARSAAATTRPDAARTSADPAPTASQAPQKPSRALDELPPFEQPVGPPSSSTPTTASPGEAPTLPQASAPVAATPATPATASAPEAAPPAARNFREMSPNYRSEFPALSVDVHVYNTDPQRRFVIVNGRRYREGDTLTEGPRITAITDDGIVFDFRGERTLYPLPR